MNLMVEEPGCKCSAVAVAVSNLTLSCGNINKERYAATCSTAAVVDDEYDQ